MPPAGWFHTLRYRSWLGSEMTERALPVLEQARQAKQIGKALEAQIVIEGTAEALDAVPGASRPGRRFVLRLNLREAPCYRGPEISGIMARRGVVSPTHQALSKETR